jgi:hypothetical protein
MGHIQFINTILLIFLLVEIFPKLAPIDGAFNERTLEEREGKGDLAELIYFGLIHRRTISVDLSAAKDTFRPKSYSILKSRQAFLFVSKVEGREDGKKNER